MNEENNDNIAVAVNELFTADDLKTIKKENLSGLGKDILVSSFNLIPNVGGMIAGVIQSIQSYRELELFRKLLLFIYEIKDTSEKDRSKFVDEIEAIAHDYSGSILTGMIDRIDNINKSVILANLVKNKILGNISIEDFFRLSSMTERIPYVDLINLPKYQVDYYDESGDTELLFATGVLTQTVIDANDNGKYRLSILGQKLLEYGMGMKLEVERNAGTVFSLNTATTEDINRIFEEKMEKRRPRVEGKTLILQ